MLKRARFALGLTGLLLAGSVQAQFTANYQTNTISNEVSNWVGYYWVGSNTCYNHLRILNAGVLSSDYGYVGCESSASNSSVLVSGAGSLWTNSFDLTVGGSSTGNCVVVEAEGKLFNQAGYVGMGGLGGNTVVVSSTGSEWHCAMNLYLGFAGSRNHLFVTNGGAVFSYSGYLSSIPMSTNNQVLVDGQNSVWSNATDCTIGFSGPGNGMVITNGGAVFDTSGYLGYGLPSSNNTVVVAGADSVWENSSELIVGYVGHSNRLTIAGGSVLAPSFIVGSASGACDNVVQLDSGSVVVTNAAHNAVLEVRRGQFLMNGGTVVADKLIVTNSCGRFLQNGGTLLVSSLQLDPAMDADGDGLANGWEQVNGLNPLVATGNDGPAPDLDGDGRSNLQEYLAGTSATNSASAFRIINAMTETNDVRVSWTAVGGKSYRVQTNAVPGSGFADLSDWISVPGSSETETNYLDLGGATNRPARFYRIRLGP